jgi:hypothetical protein
LPDQVAHRHDRERQVVADCVHRRPERADRTEQVDPGAEHPPVAAAQHVDRSRKRRWRRGALPAASGAQSWRHAGAPSVPPRPPRPLPRLRPRPVETSATSPAGLRIGPAPSPVRYR